MEVLFSVLAHLLFYVYIAGAVWAVQRQQSLGGQFITTLGLCMGAFLVWKGIGILLLAVGILIPCAALAGLILLALTD